MFRKRLIRTLCSSLVMTILPLALLLSIVVVSGMLDDEGFIHGVIFNPFRSEQKPIDLSQWTMPPTEPPVEPDTGEFPPDTGDDPGADTDIPSEPMDPIGNLDDSGFENSRDRVIFHISSPDHSGKVYLKQGSFGDYTGQGWADAASYGPLIGNTFSADYMMNFGISEGYSELLITPAWPVALVPYQMVHVPGNYIQTSDVKAMGDVSVPYALYFTSDATLVGSANEDFEADYAAYVRRTYRTVDPETAAYLQAIIDREGFDRKDPDIIEKVRLYVQNAAAYNLNYNPALDDESNVAIAFLETYGEGVCRHYATVATLLYRMLGFPARYVVGFAPTVEAGAESVAVLGKEAHAWTEIYINDMGWQAVEVTGSPVRIPITVWPQDVVARYDGQLHEPPQTINHEGFEGYLALGYTYEVTFTGGRTEVGRSDTQIATMRIYDQDHVDVTDRFDIDMTSKAGKLHVYYAELVFVSGDSTVTYNAKAQTGTDYHVDYAASANLNEGMTEDDLRAAFEGNHYRYEINAKGYVDVNDYAATFTVSIFDQDNNNVTGQDFLVHYRYGTLVIDHAVLVVRSDSASMPYNPFDPPQEGDEGWPLTCNRWTTEGLMGKDTVSNDWAPDDVIITGMLDSVGSVENHIDKVTVRDQNGRDVTGNYILKPEHGTLEIYIDVSGRP